MKTKFPSTVAVYTSEGAHGSVVNTHALLTSVVRSAKEISWGWVVRYPSFRYAGRESSYEGK